MRIKVRLSIVADTLRFSRGMARLV